MRSGPGQMPRFGDDIIEPEELDSIARYVTYLQEPDDAGGISLGRLGPIPEGMMAWLGGLGTLLVAAYFMGFRRLNTPTVDPIPPGEEPDPEPDARPDAPPRRRPRPPTTG